jgi:histidyl-tRNA synthetase
MSQRPSPPRGMRDLLPAEVALRRTLLNRILDVYGRFGFEQIETPLVEEIERLSNSDGGENTTILFKILRRGLTEWPTSEGESVDLGLRYDLTVPLARFFATNSNQLLLPFKSIQTGPVFRAERPQKGRYRQFTQCDIDILGEASLGAEVELVTATSEALRACEVGEFTIRLNHRRILESMVTAVGYEPSQAAAVLIVLDKFDKIGAAGVHEQLLAFGNSSAATALRALLERIESGDAVDPGRDLPAGTDLDALEEIQRIGNAVATAAGVKTELDFTLVRGMGYYTGAIFEIQHDEFKGSIGGGGRYDRMIGKLSGVDTPAVGFSIGFERLVHILESRAIEATTSDRIAFLYPQGTDLAVVARVAAALRAEGVVVRTDLAAKNRKAQLSRLTDAGFTHWVELRDGNPTAAQPLQKDSQ